MFDSITEWILEKANNEDMTYKELTDKCSDIWNKYGEEGNLYLGLCESRKYCVMHIHECDDVPDDVMCSIKKWNEWSDYQNEIAKEKRQKEIDEYKRNNPDEYQKYLELKKKFE